MNTLLMHQAAQLQAEQLQQAQQSEQGLRAGRQAHAKLTLGVLLRRVALHGAPSWHGGGLIQGGTRRAGCG